MQIVDTAPLVHQLGWSLLHSLWLDALIGLLLAGLLKLFTRAKPESRYWLACSALLAMMIIVPVLATFVLQIPQMKQVDKPVNIDSEVISSVDPDRQSKFIENKGATGAQKINWLNRSFIESGSASENIERFLPWLILLWSSGVVIYAIRLGGGLFFTWNLRKLSVGTPNAKLKAVLDNLTLQLGIKRRIRISESALVNVPMTIGWIYPLILVPPSSLLGLTPWQLQAIITHELIHIKRYDFLVNLLQIIVEALLFYHPAAIWVSRKIREEREYICDDRTLIVCNDSVGYARALTRIARVQKRPGQLVVAATGGGLLKHRIYRLIDNSKDPNYTKRIGPAPFAVLSLALIIVVILGGVGILSHAKQIDLELTHKPVALEATRNDQKIKALPGEYGDDVSMESPRFRNAAVQALRGYQGCIIVMDPRTGQVYTTVNQDRAFRRHMSAASVFKLVTSIAAIEENQLKDDGKGFGYSPTTHVDLTRALAVYNNDYFQLLGQGVGTDILVKYSKQFGFGEKTGIAYPNESPGYVPNHTEIDKDNLIGVTGGSIQVTPLQLAVFISAVFNGGKILIPQPASEGIAVTPQSRGDLQVSRRSIEEIKKGLRAAVVIGTAKKARQENYVVSGKTGSIAFQGTNIGLFASYGVNPDSEMVVVVVLEGKDAEGSDAAEVAGEIYNTL
jgi:beta-lactamase regulating signal transducer with metallopeptidase domain/beta-lactamase class D